MDPRHFGPQAETQRWPIEEGSRLTLFLRLLGFSIPSSLIRSPYNLGPNWRQNGHSHTRQCSTPCWRSTGSSACPPSWGCTSGRTKYPILPFAREISYRFFAGCQKYYLCCSLKSAYEISPVKLHLRYFGPPELYLVVVGVFNISLHCGHDINGLRCRILP